MKKLITLALFLICISGMIGCNSKGQDSFNDRFSAAPENVNCFAESSQYSANEYCIGDSTTISSTAIFKTDNIKRITLYSYYGGGKGSDVPKENMMEIINWLGTFSIDKEVDGLIAPGTNTHVVKIEYLDGTVVEEGLDVIEVGGVSYYVKSAPAPDCFWKIMSKTRL